MIFAVFLHVIVITLLHFNFIYQ